MQILLLEILVCPKCNGPLHLQIEILKDQEVLGGQLVCQGCERTYAITNGIPRFVPEENYASSFGYQWHVFRKTQLDSYSKLSISRDRFFRYSGWSPYELKDKWVLDIGCGSGRFAEIALSCGANVVAVDYSSSVDACWKNLAHFNRLNVVQGDIYNLPFLRNSFDFVYSFGVLQHTPNPKKAFLALPLQIKPEGKLVVDIYPKLLRNCLWSKYWFRPITRRITPEKLFKIIPTLTKMLLPISVFVGKIPIVGQKLKYMIPVVNYTGVYPLSKSQLLEWAILDTFDMLSPQHDHPQTKATLESWLLESDLKDCEVFRDGFLIGRGTKCES